MSAEILIINAAINQSHLSQCVHIGHKL